MRCVLSERSKCESGSNVLSTVIINTNNKRTGTHLLLLMLTASPDWHAHSTCDWMLLFRAGDGGHGEIVEAGRGKWVTNFKYRPGGSSPKKIWLPASKVAVC